MSAGYISTSEFCHNIFSRLYNILLAIYQLSQHHSLFHEIRIMICFLSQSGNKGINGCFDFLWNTLIP